MDFMAAAAGRRFPRFLLFVLTLLTGPAGAGCGSEESPGVTRGGPVDPGEDPVARLVCGKSCAETGEPVSFSAELSHDPEGGPLSYHLDFGDGATSDAARGLHAFGAEGAFRVVLTVTDQGGAIDQSNCLVSVGRLPQGAGALDSIELAPHYYDQRIREQSSPPVHGGMLYGFFLSGTDGPVSEIRVNGLPWSDPASPVEWCEVVPARLATGQIAAVRCMSLDSALDPGKSVKLEVRVDGATVWSRQEALRVSPLTIGYVSARADGSELLVFARNDGDTDLAVTGLAVDGVDLTAFSIIDEPIVAPGRLATIRVPHCAGVEWGRNRAYTVAYEPAAGWEPNSFRGPEAGRASAGGPASVTRAVRLFPQRFAVGNWNHDSICDGPESLASQRQAGIDLLIWYPSAECPPEVALPLAEAEDFYLFTHASDPWPEYAEAVENWGDHPRWLFNAVAGEPDIGGEPPAVTLGCLQQNQALWAERKPMWIYNACANHFPEWGAMADLGGMDHYCVWAPKCNTNWPFWYWDRIEFAGYYTAAAKRAAEPRPIVNWTQGIDNMMEIGDWQIRCNTPEEVRSQWYQNLGYGAKSLLWFRFTQSIDDDCPEEPELEMARLRAEAEQFSGLILLGEVATEGSVARSGDPLVEVTATVSPDGIVLVANNLDYELDLLAPYAWHEKTEVEIEFEPPSGFEPLRASLAGADGETAIPLEAVADGAWRVVIPSLPVANAVVVLPEP